MAAPWRNGEGGLKSGVKGGVQRGGFRGRQAIDRRQLFKERRRWQELKKGIGGTSRFQQTEWQEGGETSCKEKKKRLTFWQGEMAKIRPTSKQYTGAGN